MCGGLNGTIVGTRCDELVFGIGFTSLWLDFYNINGTGGSGVDQISVTPVRSAQGWERG
jgi:hypothetical protein